MTKDRDETSMAAVAPTDQEVSAARKVRITRRSLLRGASLAGPTILTLNSNAAFGWAITSGTIGTRAATTDAGSGATCIVGADEVDPVHKPGVYYTNGAGFVEVRGDYAYSSTSDGKNPLSAEQVCVRSGQVYYSPDGSSWTAIDPPNGAVVSFAAVSASSFAFDVAPWPNV